MSGAAAAEGLDRKLQTALDETRLLILGAQVLFGFHFDAVFQKSFPQLGAVGAAFYVAAFALVGLSLALLIAPSMHHQIANGGHASTRMLRTTSRLAGLALLPLAVSLGIDLAIVLGFRFGIVFGLLAGTVGGSLALLLWFGMELVMRKSRKPVETAERSHATPLPDRIRAMLTEARVLLPGAQALFGFQMTVLFADRFDALSTAQRNVHAASLCLVVLAVILMMAPAAFHRIAFDGEDSEEFFRLGSAFVVASAAPLALGIAGDLYVASGLALGSKGAGAAIGVAGLLVLAWLWYGRPLLRRARLATSP